MTPLKEGNGTSKVQEQVYHYFLSVKIIYQQSFYCLSIKAMLKEIHSYISPEKHALIPRKYMFKNKTITNIQPEKSDIEEHTTEI